jgi:hypothetical protein
MINKNEIVDVTYIDNVSVLDIKYGIKSVMVDNVLKDTEGNPITLPSDIEENRAELISEHNALNYQIRRKLEYPPITDYLDGVVKGNQEQIDAYIQKCLEVKAKYPKP